MNHSKIDRYNVIYKTDLLVKAVKWANWLDGKSAKPVKNVIYWIAAKRRFLKKSACLAIVAGVLMF
ncbi:MAG: hypothetical protein M0R47_12780 [Methylobacter sp.]|jgi:hypothetical protein|uniref:hypothetical protein n=1 Tax=Methylobacter sp. TaxID=2051955 RepID=UPI0025D17410|nr:hypothetical protein [Methylobacter sp.]MCK9621396.1 hypothetical protein [Methylobacter sp.]